MSVTYTATLPVREETVVFLTGLLAAERARRGTRAGARSLSCHDQAVLILRWFLDNTRLAQLAIDNKVSGSTAYDYLHEGIDVLAAQAPSLKSALLAAKAAGYSHVNIDGTLIETDRCAAAGPTPWRGFVVVGKAPQPRRQRPGRHGPRRLADLDLRGTPRPRA